MNTLRSVKNIGPLRGKRVILRASLDVPIENGVVTNDFRIKKALPTLTVLKEAGARVVILTHVGRKPENTTEPIFESLRTHTGLCHIEAVLGKEVETAVAALEDGEAILLGNLRAYPEEEANDPLFAAKLASYGDYYVNDAFAVSHRAHASIIGIPAYIPGVAGSTFMEEYENLSRVLTPEHPALFILGGAKFETKAPLIERYSTTYDTVALGGALANDFLKGRGFEVGASLVSGASLKDNPLINKENIIVPVDVVVQNEEGRREIRREDVRWDDRILDIGSASVQAFASHIANAKTILWNGPLGYYEGGFDAATKACAELVANSEAFSVVGGGDTVAAIESLGLGDQFGFLSTAGGAMLEFLEKGTLVGIDPLR